MAVTALPRGRALTRADLELLPDDGLTAPFPTTVCPAALVALY